MSRSQEYRGGIALRVCVLLLIILGLVAPTGTVAAQVDEATPIVDPPVVEADTPGNEDVSAAALNDAYFDQGQGLYRVRGTAAGTTSADGTLIIRMGGVIGDGTFSIDGGANLLVSLVGTTPSGPAVGCTAAGSMDDSVITGTFTNTAIGPASCQIHFQVRLDPENPAGSGFFTGSVDWGEGTPTELSAAVLVGGDPIISAYFDQQLYTADVGESIDVIFTIDVDAEQTVATASASIEFGALLSPYLTVSNVTGTSTSPDSVCEATATDSAGAEGVHITYGNYAGHIVFSCIVSFTVTLDSWMGDGVHQFVLANVQSTGGGGQDRYLQLNIAGYTPADSSVELKLSESTVFTGDTVTVTARQWMLGSETYDNSSSLQVELPAGVTYQPGTAIGECELGCADTQISTSPESILLTYSSPGDPGDSVSLSFDVTVDDTVAPGTVLEFIANGELESMTETAERSGPATASLTVESLLTTSDLNLDVAYAGEVEDTIAASGGTGDYAFAVQDAPGKGQLTLDPATGNFTYSADTFMTGTDSFTVLVSDTRLPDPQTALATVQVTIAEPAALTVVPLMIGATPGEVVTGNLAPQVSGGMPPYTFAVLDQPLQGTVTIGEDGLFEYHPNDDATGTDSFTYAVTDGELAPHAAAVVAGSVTITLAALPPTPTATATPSATPSPTATVTPTATVDPGMPPARPTATATATPTQVAGSGEASDSGTGVTTLPSTGTGDTDGGSMLLVLLGGALFLLLTASLGFARKRSR